LHHGAKVKIDSVRHVDKSFPRKRESSEINSGHGERVEPFVFLNESFDKLRMNVSYWIPACAGMTK